jgi:hypothetical protein
MIKSDGWDQTINPMHQFDAVAWRASQNRNEPINRKDMINRLKNLLVKDPFTREDYARNDTINILLKEIS